MFLIERAFFGLYPHKPSNSRARYVNKRVRDLQNKGYVREDRIKSTKAGFEAVEYELTAKAYLAQILNSISLEDLFNRMDEDVALEILAATTILSSVDLSGVKGSRKSFY